jgi:hypothetical protein
MEKMAMGVPNIQQQLYLKTALNESKDGMFDHPADLEEGNHMRAVRLARAGRYDDAALASNKAEASEMRRGGASKRSIKARFNKKDYAVGSKAHQRFEKAATKKRDAALKAKGIAEALEEKLEEGYQAKRMRMFRTRKPLSHPEVADFMGRSFKKKMARNARISASAGGVGAYTVRRTRRDAAMKEKGLAEGSLGLKSVLRKGKHNVGKYDKHMTKNAVRELVSRGRDPNNIKIYGTRGIENFGFQVNAKVKREKALKAKGLLPAPKPLSPEASASAARIGRLSRQRRSMGY